MGLDESGGGGVVPGGKVGLLAGSLAGSLSLAAGGRALAPLLPARPDGVVACENWALSVFPV